MLTLTRTRDFDVIWNWFEEQFWLVHTMLCEEDKAKFATTFHRLKAFYK